MLYGMHMNDPKNNTHILESCDGRLQLRKIDEPKLGAVYVDFVVGASDYRRKFGGGRSQAIAKAVGLKRGANPSVVDATAGLGRDAFVLASLGCRVHMIERSEMIGRLLENGLNRAKENAKIGAWVTERISFQSGDFHQLSANLPFAPDVVYLDPMYPEKQKSALVKKEMRMFRSLLGDDQDADVLLEFALKTAGQRVVVKRPVRAQYLAGKTPATSIKTLKNRFDIYLT